MVFAHGFGCDQNMWRFVAPEFESDFKVVLFDHVGAGGSDLSAYDKIKYSTLHGYVEDLVEIGRALGLKDAVFVGHSGGLSRVLSRGLGNGSKAQGKHKAWPLRSLSKVPMPPVVSISLLAKRLCI
jgi:pimeloyl-ACP methyl ester carboxylesterase